MATYRTTGVDDELSELRLGNPLTFPWEWCSLDGSPEQWAGVVGLAALRAGIAVQIAEIRKYSVSFAWNSDVRSPSPQYFQGVIERIRHARSYGGIALPSKEALLASRQVATTHLSRDGRRLLVVPSLRPMGGMMPLRGS
jgi:hypothetical protein